ncbi:uncharacterized protein J7T54_006090 [Emericellopsis cladophorae]|uniref:DUF1770-domain-containing protein n=1 Tax=Emericellopsis cladophorae TaxID=2686198 RepID=A0A9Q0BI17_9HYPO|nr:uncharacterized protein J7T54_006090 [Emericellopsis cladophorae]KAI6785751.1 hypothetical protein J7T54_006090 [Emericellopsis cladophorae]
MASSSIPTQIAEAVQFGHIDRHPDPIRDNAPATAAEKREVATVAPERREYDDVESDEDEDEIPVSVLRPATTSHKLPPLPDLRFEQSYLNSIASADTWWKVMLITARDQVMMPLVQGLLYNLALCGWQHWNRNARLHGNTIGARARRWWWGVNNWNIPDQRRSYR